MVLDGGSLWTRSNGAGLAGDRFGLAPGLRGLKGFTDLIDNGALRW